MRYLFFRHPFLFRWVMNLWPPFLFTGVKIMTISPDFRYARVDLKWRPWTRNINNTQFGGSLYSMTDPIYALMLFGCLGWDRYQIWDKKADIDYIAPGKGRLTAEFHIEDEQLHVIKAATVNGKKHFPVFTVNVRDQQSELVCHVERTLYVRLKARHRPAS
jgi:acyl-coenzyme A thioesterase PaaI-like protein